MFKFICPKCHKTTLVIKISTEEEIRSTFQGVQEDQLILADDERHFYKPSYFCSNCKAEVPKVSSDQELVEYIKSNGIKEN